MDFMVLRKLPAGLKSVSGYGFGVHFLLQGLITKPETPLNPKSQTLNS